MPIPCGSRGFARGALGVVLIAALPAVITNPATTHAQKDQRPPTAALQTESFEVRLKALEERRERQLGLGLTEDAERTAQEILRLHQQLQQQCSAFWSLLDRSTYAMSSREAIKLAEDMRETLPDLRLVAACGPRPGSRAQPNPSYASPEWVQANRRRQIENQDSMARSLLFVEPVLSTTTDADVPSPLYGADGAGTLQNDLAKESHDLNRQKAVLEEALSAAASSPPIRAYVLELLRFVDEARGDTAGALRQVEAQLALLEQTYGTDSPRVCHPLWHSIPLLLDTQQPNDAVAAARRCLALVSNNTRSLTYASALNNLGLALQRTAALGPAIDLYQQSLTVLAQFPVSPSTALERTTRQPPHLTVRSNLGLAHWQTGDLQLAAQQFDMARTLMLRESGPFITERNAVVSLAKLEAEVEALVSLERDMAARVPGPPPLLALPILLERKGLALEEKAAAVKVFAQDAGNLTQYRSLLALRARLARGTPISPGNPAPSDQQISEVDFQIQSLELEAQSRAQGMAQSPAITSAEMAEFEKYRREVRDETARLVQQYQKPPPKNDTRSDDELNQWFEQAVKAKVDPRYKKVLARMEAVPRGVREALLGRLQTRLPADAVLLEMLRFRPLHVAAASETDRWQPARYGTYVIKREGAPTFVDFGESAAIDDLIAEFRRTLAQPRGTLAHDLGRRLDAILMQPVRTSLGTATTIHLAPDGALNLVPFAALVDENDRYLIEHFTFDYLSSGRDLLRPVSAAPAVTTTVVIGDPAFDGTVVPASSPSDATLTRGLADHRFEPIPGTAAEAQAVAGLLKASTVLTGAAATETAIKAVQAPRVLHIATHGFFLADQDLSAAAAPGGGAGLEDPMLRSGLVFAGANIGRSGTDDGVLTAFEAAGLNLSGTQLVVLSACETGVGEVRNGEGVFGLRRAFMVAGTETLVMSLWQVEDTATEQLMTEFYRRLSNGQGRAEALRQASLTLMRDPSRRHPFFWGSFIASGEAGPLHR